MKLHPLALSLACGVLWSAVVLLVTVLNQLWPPYGGAFLSAVASIYPGFDPPGLGAAVIGMLYALVDGAIFGFVVAWLYNTFSPKSEKE